MRKVTAASGTAVFFALAPGVVAGLVPWWLTGWRLRPAPEWYLAVRVAGGPVAYQRFLHWSASPWAIVLNVVTAAFLLYHTVTFINLTPQAMVVQVRGRRVPPRLLLGPLYLAWVVVSAVLVWLVVM